MKSIAAVLLVLLCLALAWTHKSRVLSRILTISLTIYVALWNAFPFIYSMLRQERLRAPFVGSLFYEVVALEFFHVLVTVIVLNLISNYAAAHRVHRADKPTTTPLSDRRLAMLLLVALAIHICSHAYSIYSVGYSFIDRVQYSVSEANKNSALGSTLSTLGGWAPPFAMACLFFRARSTQSRVVPALSLAILMSQAVLQFVYGMRSAVLFPIILAILFFREHPPKKNWSGTAATVALAVVSLVIGAVFGMPLTSVRSQESYDAADLSAASVHQAPVGAGEYGLSILDETYTKFDQFTTGAALLVAEGESRATFSLITTSLTSAIPRALYASKPVPFSSDGEYSGIPYYLVPCLAGTCTPGAVVPVAPSAIALWEYGYFSIFLSIMSNVANLLFLNALLNSKSLLAKTMAFLLLGVPIFGMLIAPTGWIIKESSRVLLVMGAVSLAMTLRPARATPLVESQ